MKDKIRFIIVPYLITLIGLIVVYSFLHWLLLIELKLFVINESIVNVYIPIAISAFIVWYILWPGYKILNLDFDNLYIGKFFALIFTAALALPLITSQNYLIESTGRLTELNSIKEINNVEATKYYTFKNYYIDRRRKLTYTDFEISGRHKQDLKVNVYILLPIYEEEGSNDLSTPIAWYAMKRSKTIDNDLGRKKKDDIIYEFERRIYDDLKYKDLSDFTYFDRIGYSDDLIGFEKMLESYGYYPTGQIVLIGYERTYESRYSNSLGWFKFCIIFWPIIYFIVIACPKINEKKLKRFKERKLNRKAGNEMLEN